MARSVANSRSRIALLYLSSGSRTALRLSDTVVSLSLILLSSDAEPMRCLRLVDLLKVGADVDSGAFIYPLNTFKTRNCSLQAPNSPRKLT